MQNADVQNDLAAQPIAADDAPPPKLDDAEIARLVSLSSQAGYHRTDSIPIKPKESFKPRTLVTIAMEAQRRLEAEMQQATAEDLASAAAAPSDAPESMAASGETAAAPASGGPGVPGTTTDETATSAEPASGQAASDAAVPEAGAEAGSEAEPELSEEEKAAAAAAEKLQAEFDRGFAAGRAEGEAAGNKAGHDKGYEAGRAAGQAEASAQLEKAIQGFEKAALALANPDTLDLDALMNSLKGAILKLASERAGTAIAELPEMFAKRIEAILSGVKAGSEAPQIRLNPDDLAALKPILETREKLQRCTLVADETLANGDVRMTINGIGIDDALENRVSTPQGGAAVIHSDADAAPTVDGDAAALAADPATATPEDAAVAAADQDQNAPPQAATADPEAAGAGIGRDDAAETKGPTDEDGASGTESS